MPGSVVQNVNSDWCWHTKGRGRCGKQISGIETNALSPLTRVRKKHTKQKKGKKKKRTMRFFFKLHFYEEKRKQGKKEGVSDMLKIHRGGQDRSGHYNQKKERKLVRVKKKHFSYFGIMETAKGGKPRKEKEKQDLIANPRNERNNTIRRERSKKKRINTKKKGRFRRGKKEGIRGALWVDFSGRLTIKGGGSLTRVVLLYGSKAPVYATNARGEEEGQEPGGKKGGKRKKVEGFPKR